MLSTVSAFIECKNIDGFNDYIHDIITIITPDTLHNICEFLLEKTIKDNIYYIYSKSYLSAITTIEQIPNRENFNYSKLLSDVLCDLYTKHVEPSSIQSSCTYYNTRLLNLIKQLIPDGFFDIITIKEHLIHFFVKSGNNLLIMLLNNMVIQLTPEDFDTLSNIHCDDSKSADRFYSLVCRCKLENSFDKDLYRKQINEMFMLSVVQGFVYDYDDTKTDDTKQSMVDIQKHLYKKVFYHMLENYSEQIVEEATYTLVDAIFENLNIELFKQTIYRLNYKTNMIFTSILGIPKPCDMEIFMGVFKTHLNKTNKTVDIYSILETIPENTDINTLNNLFSEVSRMRMQILSKGYSDIRYCKLEDIKDSKTEDVKHKQRDILQEIKLIIEEFNPLFVGIFLQHFTLTSLVNNSIVFKKNAYLNDYSLLSIYLYNTQYDKTISKITNKQEQKETFIKYLKQITEIDYSSEKLELPDINRDVLGLVLRYSSG